MSEFFFQIERLLTAFSDPEYRYLLLEPLIFYGILAGVGMLVAGLFLKATRLQTAAVAVIGAAALVHVPYKEARLAAQPRIEQVYKIDSPPRAKGFRETTQGWVASSWKFRSLVLGSVLCLLVGVNRNRFGFSLGIATAAIAMFAAKDAVWFHYQDSLAYHPNLKQHVAPIDQRQNTSPPRERSTAPPAAGSSSISPAGRADSGAVSRIDASRIPPPIVPDSPRPRSVVPLR